MIVGFVTVTELPCIFRLDVDFDSLRIVDFNFFTIHCTLTSMFNIYIWNYWRILAFQKQHIYERNDNIIVYMYKDLHLNKFSLKFILIDTNALFSIFCVN